MRAVVDDGARAARDGRRRAERRARHEHAEKLPHRAKTLLNALLYHHAPLAAIPRAGIVHRLDKDTTGLMMVAKTLTAQTALVAQLQARTVSREYDAIVVGAMTAGGKVDAPIGRHPKDRQRQAGLRFSV